MLASLLFSICIPTIGRFDLIKTALESLQKQTGQDFEVIIGDSHHNPDIVRYVESLGDPRIRVVHPPPDAGAFSPWDYPPRFARGDYIMWLDDDNALLPFALELFSDCIKRTHADIITASHLYYYDDTHPRRHLRRTIGIVPFTGEEYDIDLRTALRQTFSFARPSKNPPRPRFHFSATIVARPIVEAAYARLGHVLFPDLPHMHSLTPILFTFAKTCRFVDIPVAVIGRLGVSMSQTWSTAARKRFTSHGRENALSPLRAYTKINTRYESYLRVRQALPEEFRDIPIDEQAFAEIHLRELYVLDAPLGAVIRHWREYFRYLKRFDTRVGRRLQRKAVLYAAGAPIVHLSRRLRLHYIRRLFESFLRRQKPRHTQSSEFEVPLPGDARYDNITYVALHACELIEKATGKKFPVNAALNV
ncbi:MAG TPA: glycosyltransferase family 2 protein [Candidatus Paceibacterota bacterium]